MKSLKLLLILVASLLVSAPSAMADVNYDSQRMQWLNEDASLEFMQIQLKAIFPTAEDHRLIDYEFVKLKKFTESWLWRYEVKADSVAFRVNGKVQAYFKPVPENLRAALVNGQKIEFKKGLAFRAYMDQVEAAFNQKTASFEQIFIHRAEAFAFFPLLVGGALGFFAGRAYCQDGSSSSSSGGATQASSGGVPVPDEINEISSCRTGNCNRQAQQQPRQAGRCVLSRVENNGRTVFSSRQMVISYRRWRGPQACMQTRRDGTTFYRQGCFYDVNSCTQFKMGYRNGRYHSALRNQRGWGRIRSQSDAQAVCQALQNHWNCRNGGYTPAPQQPQQPAYPPQNGWDIVPPGSNK